MSDRGYDRRSMLKLGGLSLAGATGLGGCVSAATDTLDRSPPPAYTEWLPATVSGTTYTRVDVDAVAASDARGVALDSADLPSTLPVAFAYPLFGTLSTTTAGAVIADRLGIARDASLAALSDAGVETALRAGDSYVLTGEFTAAPVAAALDGYEAVGTADEYTFYERPDRDWSLFRPDVAVALRDGTLVLDTDGNASRVERLVETKAGKRDRLYDVDADFAASVDAVGDQPAVRGQVDTTASPLFADHSVFGTARVAVAGVTTSGDPTAVVDASYDDPTAVPDSESAATALEQPIGPQLAVSVDGVGTDVDVTVGDGGIEVGVDTVGTSVQVTVDDRSDGADAEANVDATVEDTRLAATATWRER